MNRQNCCYIRFNVLFLLQDFGKSNAAFEEEEDHRRLSGRNPPRARQRQQVRDVSSGFNNVAFEQDDGDQQSITPPPPYPADGQVLYL